MAGENKSFNISSLKEYITLGVMLVSGALAWGNIHTQIDLLAQKQDLTQQQQEQANQRVQTMLDDHSNRLNSIEKDVAVIKDTLQVAKDRGILSRATTKPTVQLAAATPTVSLSDQKTSGQSAQTTPQPSEVTYNTTINHTDTTNAPTPTPFQSSQTMATPTPSPPSSGAIPDVIKSVIDILL